MRPQNDAASEGSQGPSPRTRGTVSVSCSGRVEGAAPGARPPCPWCRAVSPPGTPRMLGHAGAVCVHSRAALYVPVGCSHRLCLRGAGYVCVLGNVLDCHVDGATLPLCRVRAPACPLQLSAPRGGALCAHPPAGLASPAFGMLKPPLLLDWGPASTRAPARLGRTAVCVSRAREVQPCCPRSWTYAGLKDRLSEPGASLLGCTCGTSSAGAGHVSAAREVPSRQKGQV